MDPEEPRPLRAGAPRRRPQPLEGRSGVLEHAGPLSAVLAPQELQEADRIPQPEPCRRDPEGRPHLLLGGESREELGDRGAEEPIAEEIRDLRREPLQDLEPPAHPFLPPAQPPCDLARREAFPEVEVTQRVDLLPQCRLAGGVVPAQPLELRLNPPPGLHDRPGPGPAALPQGQVALEAVDEKEPPLLLDHHEGIVPVDLARAPRVPEELEGDLFEGDLADRHRGLRGSRCAGSERTWKVG